MTNGTTTSPGSLVVDNTNEEQRQFLRARCRGSLYFLCKAVLGFKDFTPGVHLRACNFIQEQAHVRKLFMLPRGFFKSHLATIGYPVWLVIQEPNDRFRGSDERILIANATATNSEHFLSKIKAIFERNALFQWLFPEIIPDFASRHITWNIGSATLPRKNDYPEPTFSTIGVGGAVVGRHFTRIILDDLINDQHAASPELMRKAIEWYKYTESLLEVPGRDELVVIGTRWAFSDLYSSIEESEGEISATNPLGYARHIRSALEDDQPIFPERFNFAELARLRVKLGDYMFACNPKGAPILMGDFQSKPIEDVRVGDEVIGFTESGILGRSKLALTRVVHIGSRIAPVVKVTLRSGRVVRCTPDHRWFTGRWPSEKHSTYLPPKIGRKMMFVCDPHVDATDTDGKWLAGIYDGEGSCTRHLTIAQKRSYNPLIWDEIEFQLKVHGYYFNTAKNDEMFVFGCLWEERRRFLLQINPIKKQKIINSLLCGRWVKEQDEVIKIEDDGIEVVYSLQTETGNYICWGYASKNCLYLNAPRGVGINDFNRDWLRYYRFGDKGKLILDDGRVVDPLEMDRVAIVDIATSVRREADYSAVVVVGVDESRRVMLLEAWRGRVQTRQLIEQIFKFAARWRVRAIYYEDSAQQKLIQYSLEEYRKETGQYIQVLPVKAGNKQTKEQRIRMVSQYFQQNMVFIRESMTDFVNDYSDFPLGKHDDLIDAFSYFPRCVRFNYPEIEEEFVPEEDRIEAVQHSFDMDVFLRGRNPVSGY